MSKKCPFCAEEVNIDAKICKYCHGNIAENEKPFYKKSIGTGRIVFWIVFLLLLFWFWNWIKQEQVVDVKRSEALYSSSINN